MNKIHKLKPPKAKSSQDAIELLQDCLKMAREEKVTFVGIVLVTKDNIQNPFYLDKDGTYSESMGAIERLKYRLMERWNS